MSSREKFPSYHLSVPDKEGDNKISQFLNISLFLKILTEGVYHFYGVLKRGHESCYEFDLKVLPGRSLVNFVK